MWIKRDEKINTIDDFIKKNSDIRKYDENVKYEYPHLQEGVNLFVKHVRAGHKIKIYGDYDVDGVTSLTDFNCLGKAICYNNISVIAPDRFSDGYGITVERVEEIAKEGVKLLVTVDNGITAIDAIKRARELGLDVLVLDHHELEDGRPLPDANVIVDLHVTGADPQTGFDDLCGAGLSLRFSEAVIKAVGKVMSKERYDMVMQQLYAITAIGTIADVVSLTFDNRYIVKRGLDAINAGQIPEGMKALIKAMNINGEITSETIAFGIAPAINSAGRLEANGAMRVVNLFCMSSIFASKMTSEIEHLLKLNAERKKLVEEEVDRATSTLNIRKDDRVGIYVNRFGQSGIMGLVASELAKHFKRPTFALCGDVDIKGSGRSFGDVNIYDALCNVSDLLKSFGGHAQACGLSLKRDDLTTVKDRLNKLTPKVSNPDDIYYDIELTDTTKAKDILNDIKVLEPYGCGNPAPRFLLNFKAGNVFRMGKHIKISVADDFYVLSFNHKGKIPKANESLSVIGTLSSNTYQGKTSYQITAEALS